MSEPKKFPWKRVFYKVETKTVQITTYTAFAESENGQVWRLKYGRYRNLEHLKMKYPNAEPEDSNDKT